MIPCDKLASLLVSYCIEGQTAERVRVDANVVALPLVQEVYAKLLQAGSFPDIKLHFSNERDIFYEYAQEHQLREVSPVDVLEAETVRKLISIRSEENTIARSFPEKEAVRATAAKLLSEKSKDWRWVLTLYPTNAYAQEAGMTLREFEAYYIKALFLNHDNPSEKWKDVARKQEEYISLFSQKSHVEIRGQGIALSFNIENRTFINSDGKQNMPSGEIYTSPIEDSVEGTYVSNVPNTKYGSEISGARLVFQKGRIVEAEAEKGQELLNTLIQRDDGARSVGEFGVGCNYVLDRYVRNILFDEKIGGTVHIAIGQGYEKAGGKNKSNIHLDLIYDMRKGGEIVVDGTVIYKDGCFRMGARGQ